MHIDRRGAITCEVYLLHAAERYQDWIERGDREVAEGYWLSMRQFVKTRWPGDYEIEWCHAEMRIDLVFKDTGAEVWFRLQHK